MADYFTHFSCLLDVGTPDKAARALALFQELRAADRDADDPEVMGFDLVRQDAPEGSIFWIHDDDHGDVEAVIRSKRGRTKTPAAPAATAAATTQADSDTEDEIMPAKKNRRLDPGSPAQPAKAQAAPGPAPSKAPVERPAIKPKSKSAPSASTAAPTAFYGKKGKGKAAQQAPPPAPPRPAGPCGCRPHAA